MEEKRNVPKLRFPGFTDPWEQRKLEDAASFGGGHTPSMADPSNYENGSIPWVTSQDVKTHYLSKTKTLVSDKGAEELNLYPAGSLVVVVRSGILRHTLPVAELRKPMTVNQDIRVIIPAKSLSAHWLLGYFEGHDKELLLKFGKVGTTVESVNFSEMKSMVLPMPSMAEQAKIGALFQELDSLITLHQRKLDHVKEQKKGLLQKMFPKEGASVPELRFPGFTDPWEQRKLGEFATKQTSKNSDGSIKESFTNSAEYGVVSQLDYFDHGITNDANVTNYTVVEENDFVYNPRISVTAPVGPINRCRLSRSGVMSPLYTVFRTDETVDRLYLEHYFKTKSWHSFMYLEGNSGVRSDRFSISDRIFFEMPIACPSLEEQNRIARFMERLDSLIALHQRELDHIKELKKRPASADVHLRKEYKKMNDLNEISSKLWAMANELRGNMDAAEYKNYILAFMFYRYLSEHQEEYLVTNNVLDVEPGQTVNQAYLEQANNEELADYLEDISSSLGYAIEPLDTWASLVHKIDESMVIPSDYQSMFDHFNKNAELNKEAERDFRGVFNDVNLGDSRLGSSTNDRAKSLNRIVKLVDSIEYKSDDGKDILGAIYEYLIKQFAASAGKKGGEFYTPHEVSEILAKIVTMNWDDAGSAFSVYDPTMGSGSLLLTVGQELPDNQPIKYYGQELNTTTYNLARMNLMLHGVSFNNMALSNADTLEGDWPDGPDEKGIDRPRSFDAVVANPPYSAHWDNSDTKLKDARFKDYGKLAPKTKADYAFILHSLYHLKDGGTMAIVLPHGVLFRGAAEGVIRKAIIENKNYLDTVIGLPANIFYGTGIPTIILVFKKGREAKDILFIDASREFEKAKNQNRLTPANIEKIIETYRNREDVEKYAHVASLDEVRENDYNLNIPRYVDTFEEEEEIDLNEVLKLIEQDKREIAELEQEIADQLKLLGV